MSKNTGNMADVAELDYMIASHLCTDVEKPLARLYDTMSSTARKYIEKSEGDGMLEHCDAMELAVYMECFSAQLKDILAQVGTMVTEHDKRAISE